MEWTAETPTKEGVYWFWWADADRISPEILRIGARGRLVSEGTSIKSFPVGRWYGPLTPPPAPEQDKEESK